MDTVTLLKERQSLRVYDKRGIPSSVRTRILEAAASAPTAGGLQLYAILEVEDAALKQQLADSCDDQPFIAKAPWVVIFLADYQRLYAEWDEAGLTPSRTPGIGDFFLANADAIIAAQTAVIAAHSMGIGSCYIGDIIENAEKHRAILHLPPYVYPAAMLCFGYPPDGYSRDKVPRLPIEGICHRDTYDLVQPDAPTAVKRSFAKFEAPFSVEMNRSAAVWLTDWRVTPPQVAPPLPLKGSYNTRDLGGYPTPTGITKYHRLLRSDGLQSLTTQDTQSLYDYGVRRIIDLRSDGELLQAPCAMLGMPEVTYLHVPLIDEIHANNLQGSFPESLFMLYHNLLLNSQGSIAVVLRAILDTPQTVLFNCTAGKDRTGVIAMLLLLLAGVSPETVVADYAVSQENLTPLVTQQKAMMRKLGIEVPEHVFESPAVQMQQTLAFLTETYKDAAGYLAAIGLTSDEIQGLMQKLHHA